MHPIDLRATSLGRWLAALTRRPRLPELGANSQPPSGEVQRQVDEALVRGVYSITRHSYRTTLVYALLVFFNFYERVPTPALWGWFAATVAVSVLRLLAARRFQRLTPARRHLGRWHALAAFLAALQALTWGGVLLMAAHTEAAIDLSFAIFLICALAFGALSGLGFSLPVYLSFALPLVALLWGWMLWAGAAEGLWLAVTVAFGGYVMFDSASHASRIMRRALLLGRQREELIQRLTEEKDRVQVTLQSIGDGVLTTDLNGRVTYLNPVAARLTGWSDAEARGRPLTEVLCVAEESSGDALPDLLPLCLSKAGPVVLEADTVLVDRSGARESAVEITASPIRDHSRRIIGMVVVAHDVTELRGMARVMSYQARHDPLTGLINRREFEVRLWQALEQRREAGRPHALCYLDLDQFKLVNDTCGHLAGDELLKQIAELLQQRLCQADVLARLGGDEFGLLLHDCELDHAHRVADALCAALRRHRFEWEGNVFTVGVSIGVVDLDAGSTPAALLAAADAACYVAKDEGRNRVHSVYPQDRQFARRNDQMQWATRIQRALDEARFELSFQRIKALSTEEADMAELLLCMVGEEGERIAPGVFLPAAERFNMMPAIDRAVVQLAFGLLAERQPVGRGRIARFTVNLSGQSLSDDQFLDYVLEQLDTSGADPLRICFEITETAVIANLGRARRFIEALRRRGCRFALDDFGSGLSSYAYLRALPVDYLKIDGMFVRQMCRDAVDYSMVESINQVGHVMGIRTIAEYVEEEAVMEALRDMGVDYVQGFGVHRPEPLVKSESVAEV